MLNIDPTVEYVLLFDYREHRTHVTVPRGTVVTNVRLEEIDLGGPGTHYHIAFTDKETGKSYKTILREIFALNTPENLAKIDYERRLRDLTTAGHKLAREAHKSILKLNISHSDMYKS